MRITFIVSDLAESMMAGGEIERTSGTMEIPDSQLPLNVRNYLKSKHVALANPKASFWQSISLAIETEEPK